MKIVVLDGYTLNPGDLSWDGLRELGHVTVYDRTPKDLVISHSQKAEILLMEIAVNNLKAFLSGHPVNQVI